MFVRCTGEEPACLPSLIDIKARLRHPPCDRLSKNARHNYSPNNSGVVCHPTHSDRESGGESAVNTRSVAACKLAQSSYIKYMTEAEAYRAIQDGSNLRIQINEAERRASFLAHACRQRFNTAFNLPQVLWQLPSSPASYEVLQADWTYILQVESKDFQGFIYQLHHTFELNYDIP